MAEAYLLYLGWMERPTGDEIVKTLKRFSLER